MGNKNYCVVLTDEGVAELKRPLRAFIRESEPDEEESEGDDEKYYFIYAKKIDPNGPYLHMVVEAIVIDFEIQIPHRYVRAIYYAEDEKALGFLASGKVGEKRE